VTGAATPGHGRRSQVLCLTAYLDGDTALRVGGQPDHDFTFQATPVSTVS
jgi:hypothetical protein